MEDENTSRYRDGSKTLKEKSKWHPNTKERSMSKSPFGTFGGTLKVPNWHLLGFGPTAFG